MHLFQQDRCTVLLSLKLKSPTIAAVGQRNEVKPLIKEGNYMIHPKAQNCKHPFYKSDNPISATGRMARVVEPVPGEYPMPSSLDDSVVSNEMETTL
jgi:hypothetical protein